MNPFAQAVEGWHDFYHVVGDATAALMRLLFVSLSLNADDHPDAGRYHDL